MTSNQVFIDTSMFFALVHDKDEFHNTAASILKKLETEKTLLITSNYVLDETFTLIRLRRGIKIADNFRRSLTRGIKIVRITVADEAGAWQWFLKDWSKLSFTDCVSFAAMTRLGLKRVATFDKDFQKAGFQIQNP